jgi:hypothetical protein
VSDGRDLPAELDDGAQIVLSDLINRVLDKGVVIRASITLSVADVDLVQLELNLLLTSIVTRDRSNRK